MKAKTKKVKCPEIQYFSTSLRNIIIHWSRVYMAPKDWEVEAIDQFKDRVVFKRFQRSEN